MKRKKILIIILIIAIIFLIFSIINIYFWHKDNNKNNEIKKIIEENVEVIEQQDTENTIIVNKDETIDLYQKYKNMSLIDVDLNELKKINSDTIGWISINGTEINYPFVQANDNSYYLTHSFNKTKNSAGWMFLDYRNNINIDEKNTIIYAHNRQNETMFGNLSLTLKDSWYNNPENHFIKISTLTKNSLWQIFSIYTINEENTDYLKTSFSSEAKYNDFIGQISKRSNKKFSLPIYTSDKILTLSTCHKENERLIVHAKLIKYEKKEV